MRFSPEERNPSMRWITCTVIVCVAIGCRGQSSSLTNPFLAPDRVPPPGTRTLQPGTAQPYYPGDPMPTTPGSTTPGSGTNNNPYGSSSPNPNYSPPASPVTPPGNWNSQPVTPPTNNPYSPQSNNTQHWQGSPNATSPMVQVQPDSQSLRETANTHSNSPPGTDRTYTGSQSNSQFANTSGQWSSPDVLPPGAPQNNQANSRDNELQPASYDSSPANQPQRAVQLRAVNSREGLSQSSDGFRAQGSTPSHQQQAFEASSSTLQPPSQQESRNLQTNANRFGFDPQYRWLRGQLQYSPETGQWWLRYNPPQQATDPLGGALWIENPQVLGNLQPGDFVAVEGELANTADPSSAVYTVTRLQRQRIAE